MIKSTELLEIVSGRRRGFVAALIRSGLACLTPIYRFGVWYRNRRFDKGGNNAISVPVISIGNLTTGGTGKTPMVIWVVQQLQSHSLRVAIISRGYGRQNMNLDRNDEALELEHRLPGVPHLQDPDRTSMAKAAIAQHKSQIIVLDDGFQHRKLNRDLDIVLIDATEPFGYERLLPRGLLREPVSSLSRAQAVVLTRCDAVDTETTEGIRQTVEKYSPQAIWARSKTVAQQGLQFDGRMIDLDDLAGKKILAISGIGNPKGFEHSLSQLHVNVAKRIDFPDHHSYSREDINKIQASAEKLDVEAVVCTHKDLVKMGVNQLGQIPLYALVIRIEFVEGEQELADAVTRLVFRHSSIFG